LYLKAWHILSLPFKVPLLENNIVRALEGIFKNGRFKEHLAKPVFLRFHTFS
jgi:hypothetical protein